jgi:ribosomal protein L18E
VCEAVDRAAPAAAPGASAGGATPGASATPAAKPSSGDTTSSGLRVAAIRADRLKRALLRGLGVDVVTPAAGKLIVEARRGRTLVAKGTATAHGAGTTKVQVRFTKAARRKLRRARSVTLTLTVRAGEASTTRSLRLK